MRLRSCGLKAGVVVLLAAFPATVAAKPQCTQTTAPQGNSEAEQYSETVPGSCGNHTVGGGGAGSSSHNAVPSQTLHQLQSQGPAGQNAATLAQGTGPTGAGGGSANQPGAKGGGGGGNGNQSNGGGAFSGVGDALAGDTGGSGVGLLLPLILAGTLLAGVAFWLIRRRAGPAS
jgi:hypothetical protein